MPTTALPRPGPVRVAGESERTKERTGSSGEAEQCQNHRLGLYVPNAGEAQKSAQLRLGQPGLTASQEPPEF